GPLVAVLLVLFILAGIACGGSHRVLLPPRLNLSPYGQIGLVTFTAENAKGSLHEFATRRFSEYVLAAQTGIEVLELGAADSVLRRTRSPELGPAAAAWSASRCHAWRPRSRLSCRWSCFRPSPAARCGAPAPSRARRSAGWLSSAASRSSLPKTPTMLMGNSSIASSPR